MPNAPIVLTGPNPSQPFDIQTQQAQIAQQQALAYAMLQQAISPTSPTVHTGGNNPFARDVVNLAPLGNFGSAILNRKRIEGLNKEQQDLANQYLTRHVEELNRAFSPTMPGGAPSVMGTQQPSMLDAAKKLIRSLDPQNAQLGGSILSQIAKGEEARQVTPATNASLVRAGVLPESIGWQTGPFGFPTQTQQDVNAMRMKPQFENVPPGHTLYAASPQAGTATSIGQPTAPPAVVTPPEQTMPGGAPNPTGAPVQTSPTTGMHTPVPGPQLAGAEASARAGATELTKEQTDKMFDAQNFKYVYLPQYYSMAKLVQKAISNGGNFGFGAEELNTVRSFFAQVGLNPDKVGNIPDWQTFVKSAVPLATARLREGVGARPSQMEFAAFLEALTAKGNSDPRAMMNIVQDRILNSMNDIDQFFEQNKNLAKVNPYMANALQFAPVNPADIMTELGKYGIQPNWKKNATGAWQNYNVGQTGVTAPGLFGGSKTTAPQTLNPGWSQVQ